MGKKEDDAGKKTVIKKTAASAKKQKAAKTSTDDTMHMHMHMHTDKKLNPPKTKLRKPRGGRCVCPWPEECMEVRALFQGHAKLGRHFRLHFGFHNRPLRANVEKHFGVDPEKIDNMVDLEVANHHWHPALVDKNFDDRGRLRRKFLVPITRSEAEEYEHCNIAQQANEYVHCMKMAFKDRFNPKDIKPEFVGRYVQAPTFPLSKAREYAESLPARDAAATLAQLFEVANDEEISKKPVAADGTATKSAARSDPKSKKPSCSNPVINAAGDPKSKKPPALNVEANTALVKKLSAEVSAAIANPIPSAKYPPSQLALPAANAVVPSIFNHTPQARTPIDPNRINLVLPIPNLQDFIRYRYNSFSLEENKTNKDFLTAFRLLRDEHQSFEAILCSDNPLKKPHYLHPCRGHEKVKCLLFRDLMRMNSSTENEVLCDECARRKRGEQRRLKSESGDLFRRTALDSKVPNANLTPEELRTKLDLFSKERRSSAQRAKRLEEKMKEMQQEIDLHAEYEAMLEMKLAAAQKKVDEECPNRPGDKRTRT